MVLCCVVAGRNNVPCCHSKLVPDDCLDICRNQVPGDSVMDLVHCLGSASDIMKCFLHGQGERLTRSRSRQCVNYVKVKMRGNQIKPRQGVK